MIEYNNSYHELKNDLSCAMEAVLGTRKLPCMTTWKKKRFFFALCVKGIVQKRVAHRILSATVNDKTLQVEYCFEITLPFSWVRGYHTRTSTCVQLSEQVVDAILRIETEKTTPARDQLALFAA